MHLSLGLVIAIMVTSAASAAELPTGKPVRVVDLMGTETLVQPGAGKVPIALKDKQAVFLPE
jgi:hypothetical protein